MKLGKRVIAIMLSTIMSVSVMNTNMLTIRAAADTNIAMEENAEDILEGENQDEDVTVTEETENAGNENDATTAPASENVTEDIEDTEDIETTDETNTIDENDDEEEADTKEIVPEEEKNKLATTEDDTKTTEDTSKDKIAPQDLEEEEQDEEEEIEGKVRLSEKNFPDDNFRNYLKNTFDKDNDNLINIFDVKVIDYDGSFNRKKIESLQGIEKLEQLVRLDCYGNEIKLLDVSKNVLLEELNCCENNISELDVSGNLELKYFYCAKNDIRNIDVTKNTKLLRFTCSDNKIEGIDVSNNVNLTSLSCADNKITKLDLENNVNLTSLSCENNKITKLDLENNIELSSLVCYGNNIREIDISKNNYLQYLHCSNNYLDSIDVSNNLKLESLYCSYNNIVQLDVSKNTSLSYLDCGNNNIHELNLANCVNLNRVHCEYNELLQLDLKDNINLISLDCRYNELSELDVSNNSKLTDLNFQENKLHEIDISNNNKLSSLYLNWNYIIFLNASTVSSLSYSSSSSAVPFSEVYHNKDIIEVDRYTNFDISKISNLKNASIVDGNIVINDEGKRTGSISYEYDYGRGKLKVEINKITSDLAVDEAGFPDSNFREYLKSKFDTDNDGIINTYSVNNIDCSSLKIKSLVGIENFEVLENLNCNFNEITELDLSANRNLVKLSCNNNIISTLDVSSNPKLTEIYCSNNKLTKLNLDNNSLLTKIDCSNNYLTSIDVSKLSTLKGIDCSRNNLTELDLNNNLNLQEINCASNKLTDIDIATCTKLEKISCEYNNISELNIAGNVNLSSVKCSSNNLSELNVSKNKYLEKLYFDDNKITGIDLSNNSNLKLLSCSYNELDGLDVSKNRLLERLACGHNPLGSLDVSKNIELLSLSCYEDELENLDVSNNLYLTALTCSYNQLGCLNLRNNLELTYTQCDNQLISATAFNGASNGRFDYSIYKGFEEDKVSKLEGGDFEDNVLYVNDIGRGNGKITYTYNCGNGQSMDVTIDNINKVVSMKYDAPELESIKNSTVGVQFKWLPVEGATQYRVYRKSDDSVWMKMADTFATEYIDTTVESGKTYAYTVCCVSEDSKAFLSEYNQNGISIMFIATPNISEAINSNEGIQLAWKEVEGANRYRVYRKSQSEDWQNVAETNETSFIDEKVNIGDEYTYTVCCVDANGEDVVSDFDQTGIMVECTISPQDIKNRNDYAEYKSSIITLVNAQAVDGDSAASKKLIKDAISQINQKAYSATSSLDNNKQEIRKILEKLEKDLVAQRQQEKEDKEKEEANKGEEPGKGDTPVKPEAMLSTPSLTSLVNVNDGLKLSWKPVDKAEKYRVFRKDKNGSWQKVADVIKPEYVDKNVSDGTSYTYTVRCVDKSGSKYRSEYDKTGRTCMYVKPVPKVDVKYMTHIQSYGWEKDYKSNGQMSGTSGQSKRLEAIKIKVEGNADLGIQYVTHCQTYGWLNWSANDEVNGTSGEAKRLEAIEINLTGKDKDKYDVYYRVHAQSYGWLGWAKNGAASGTAGYAKRLEGIQIVVLKKGEQLNKNTNGISSNDSRPYISKSQSNIVIPGGNVPHVTYKTHVQSYGWQNWKSDGEMAGTSGQAKRLEGINIKISNCEYSGDIVYTTHVQTYGWQGKENDISTWKKNGEMAGTSGEAKRLEAIRIAITGEMAKKYDVYYRVHAQSYGWLGWAKNGEASGTAGYAKRLEGIQIVLVKKGGKAPEENYGGISCNDKRPYISK